MGIFLDAAYKILKAENRPLSAKELTDKALQQGLLKSSGKTPRQTMKSKISTDILKNKERSSFKRTSSGKFALREWKEEEYHAPRFKKSLFDEDILVFNRKYLSELVDKNGLKLADLDLIFNLFNEICYPIRRRNAEENNNVVQLVSVFIVRYDDKYLTFKRTKRLPESRLHGFYSIGFGGHISPNDLIPLFNVFDPKSQSTFIVRELSEELKLKCTPAIKFRGLLYDNSMPVSRIHLGVVYDVFLEDIDYEIGERGFLMDPKFENIETINKRINDFENWSKIIIREECKRYESTSNPR